MGRIPATFIDELISRTDIVELIDQRVPLQRAGHEHRACCPFHDEKTPSFYVSPTKQFYHCFGCGAHGTAVGFLMNYANLEFVEAIEALASRAGMQVPRDGQASNKPIFSHQHLHDLLAKARAFYQQQLKSHPTAAEAVEYLKKRGLDGKTALEFGIGYAPDGWNNLSTALGNATTITQGLIDTGMLIEKDEGGYYDRFRARIMFPIEDYRGKLVGFGGRIIDQGEPKYLNSPETVLFHKGSELYGFSQGRREIGRACKSIVVEGYMDVIGLAQNGFKNAVATMGTATTQSHIQRLLRAAPAIVFCFDGDRAGKNAAWKALETALPLLGDGKQIDFLMSPQGEDPDSLVRKEGTDAFKKRLNEAQPLADFLFKTLSEPFDLNREDHRAQLAQKALPLLYSLPAGNFRQQMIQRLARVIRVNNESELVLGAAKPAQPAQPAQPIETEFLSLLARIISLLIQTPKLLDNKAIESIDALPNDEAQLKDSTLLQDLSTAIKRDTEINTAQLLERMRPSPHHAALEKLASHQHLIEEAKSAYFNDCLNKLTDNMHQQEREALLDKSRTTKLSGEENERLTTLYKLLEHRLCKRELED